MSVLERELTSEQQRARSGAWFLDQERTDHWRDKVDKEHFDIGHACNCVLGQLYGDYHRGQDALGLTAEDSRALGFEFAGDGIQEMYLLNRAWKELL